MKVNFWIEEKKTKKTKSLVWLERKEEKKAKMILIKKKKS